MIYPLYGFCIDSTHTLYGGDITHTALEFMCDTHLALIY